MKTFTTKQDIVYDAEGLPSGIQVTRSTFDRDTFVLNELVGFHVLSNSQVEAINATNPALLSANETLAAEVVTLQATCNTLTEQKITLQSQVTGLTSTVATLQAQVSGLVQYRPFDPNIIRSEAFYQRIARDELLKLGVLASTDNTAKGILLLLTEYLSHAWQVLLDDPQVVGAMQYLAAVLPLSESRVSEITRPGSAEEAYYNPLAE